MIRRVPIVKQIVEMAFKRIGYSRNAGQLGCAQFSIQKMTVQFTIPSKSYGGRY
jgi:hypothetical protein